jgi:hypothetical protein
VVLHRLAPPQIRGNKNAQRACVVKPILSLEMARVDAHARARVHEEERRDV